MIRKMIAICFFMLFTINTAQAVEPDLAAQLNWSPETQPYNVDIGCPINPDVYGGRWDVTIPAGGGNEETTVSIDPSFEWNTYGGDSSDPEPRVMAVHVANKRLQAMSALLIMHRQCALGGEQARLGCISLGQVERAFDLLTDEGRSLRTYSVPHDSNGKFTQLRYFWWPFGEHNQTYRQRTARLGFDPDQNRRWVIPETAGEYTTCPECRARTLIEGLSHTYVPPFASDYDVFSPAQVAAATAEVMKGPQAGEYVFDNQGRIIVPRCQR